MPKSHSRLVAGLSLLVLGGGILSLADTTEAEAARGPDCRCFHVTGSGPDVPQSRYGALARDRQGGEHVIAARRPHQSSQDYALSYLTRRHGQDDWSHHRVSGIPLLTGLVATFASPTPSGRQILVVANACDTEKVYLGEASLRARTVHMTAAYAPTSGDECSGVLAATYQGVAAVAHHRIALLERDPSGGPAVAIGAVGSSLPPPTVLPNPNAVSIEQSVIGEDNSTGRLFVVGGSFDDGVFAWTKPAGGSWSMPTMIAPASLGYRVDSMTIAEDKIAVGLDLADASGGLYTVGRAAGGHWSGPRRLPGTINADDNLILQFNAKSGHLHAAFNRESGSGGIFHEARVGGNWLPLRRITRNYRDEPQEITLTKKGHPVIGYQRE